MGWPAYWLVMALPIHRLPQWSVLWLVPYAGDWAYRADRHDNLRRMKDTDHG